MSATLTKQPPTEVYVSYAMKDRETAGQFAKAMREAGVRPWFDVDEIEPGEPWQAKLEEALRESRVLVLLISPDSLDNSTAYFEIGAAVAGHKRIIPVLLENTDPSMLPPFLRDLQVRERKVSEDAGRRVAEAVERTRAAA